MNSWVHASGGAYKVLISRYAKLENGQCVIGMEHIAMIPLISFDTVVNVYLTILFLIPLKSITPQTWNGDTGISWLTSLADLHTFKNSQKTPANIRLRTVAVRTFIGSVSTLVSSIVYVYFHLSGYRALPDIFFAAISLS